MNPSTIRKDGHSNEGCADSDTVDVEIRWYDRQSRHEIVWQDNEYGRYARSYLLPLLEHGTTSMFANVQTELRILTVDGIPLPITVNDAQYDNSYVCSPYTHYVSYAMQELSMLKMPWLEKGLSLLLRGIGAGLRAAHLNRVVQINNWLLSTNLYPILTAAQIEKVQAEVNAQYPRHVIIWRSLNEVTTPTLWHTLRHQGNRFIPSRQIYLLDHTNIPSKARWIIKRDRKLMNTFRYNVVRPNEWVEDDIPRMLELYHMLYIEKYSIHNPQFTADFLRLALEQGTLQLYGLRTEAEGRLDAILGFFARDGVMTTPLFGYNTSLPAETGLYRMLSVLLIELATERGDLLHESSGVGQFKRNRGAYGALEVSAVYDRGRGLPIRCCWWLLEQLLYRIGVPIIHKMKF